MNDRLVINIGSVLDSGFGAAFSRANAELEGLQTELQQLQEQQSSLERSNMGANGLGHTQEQFKQVKKEATGLRKEFGDLRKSTIQLRAEFAKNLTGSTDNKLKQVTSNVEKLSKALNDQGSALTNAREGFEGLQTELQQLQQQQSLLDRVNMGAGGLIPTQTQFKQVKKEAAGLRKELSDLRKEVVRLRTEFARNITGSADDQLNDVRQNVQQLSEAIRDLQRETDELNDRIRDQSNRLEDQSESANRSTQLQERLGQVLSVVKKTVIGFTAGIVAMGVALATPDTELIALNSQLSNLEKQLEVSHQAMQVWQYGAEAVGVPAEKMGEILQDVSDKLGDFAITGGGGAIDAIERLGLNINDLINMNPDKALIAIYEGLEKVENISNSDKVFLLEAIASDSSKLIPLLEDNAKKLREVEELTQRRGLIITPEESKILSEAGIHLSGIKQAQKGITKELGLMRTELFNEVAPAITQVFDSLIPVTRQVHYDVDLMKDVWKDSLSNMSLDSSSFAGVVGEVISGTMDGIGMLFDFTRQFFTYLPVGGQAAFIAIGAYADSWYHTTSAFMLQFNAVYNDTMSVVVEYGGMAFGALVDISGKAIGFMIERFADFVGGLSILGNIPGFEAVGEMVGSVESKLRGMAETASGAGDAIKSSFADQASAMRSAAEESRFLAAEHLIEAEAAKGLAAASIAQAAAYVERKESQRGIDQQIREENIEIGGLVSNLDKSVESGKKFTSSAKEKAEATEKAKEATKKAKEATKEHKKEVSELAKEQERIAGLFTDAANKIAVLEENLRSGADAARRLELQQDNLSAAQAVELQAMEKHAEQLQEQIDIRDKITESMKDAEDAHKLAKITLEEGTEAARLAELELEGYSTAEAQAQLAIEQRTEALETQYDIQVNIAEALKDATDEQKLATIELKHGADAARLAELELEGYSTTEAKAQQAIEQSTESLRERIDQQNAAKDSIQQLTQELEYERIKLEQGAAAAELYKLHTEGYTDAQARAKLEIQGNIELLQKQGEIAKTVNESLTDSIMTAIEGGKTSFQDLATSVKNMFNSMVLRPIIQAAMTPISNAVGGVATNITSSISGMFGGGAQTAQGGGASGGLGGLSSLSNLSKLFSGNSVGTGFTKVGSSLGTSLFSNAGSVANWQYGAAGLLGGLVGDKVFGGKGGLGGGLGASVGMAMGGPIGAVIGGLGGGVIGGLFGGDWESEHQGLNLNYSRGEFSGNQYETFKKEGGWLRGDKNKREDSDLDSELEQRLSAHFDQVETSLISTAKAFGIDSAESVITSFEAGVLEFGTDGKSAEKVEGIINDWMTGVSDSLYTAVFGTEYDQFKAEGETLADTLMRLHVSITTVQTVTEGLGLEFDLVGAQAAAASLNIIEAAGGLESLAAGSSTYYEHFYTETEKLNRSFDALSGTVNTFNELHGASITTKASLRDFVDSLDLTTTAGQAVYGAAMQLAPTLVELDDVTAKLDQSSGDATESMSDFSAEIKAAVEGIQSMFSSTIEQIDLDLMTQEEKRQKYMKEAETLFAQLESESDPDRIAEISEQINDAVSKAWQSMTEEQKQAHADSLKQMLSSASDIATSQLSTTDLMREAVQAMHEPVEQMGVAADDMQLAANDIETAASSLLSATDSLSSDMQTAANAVAGAVSGIPTDININVAANDAVTQTVEQVEEADGSHSGGLYRVPFDDYRAILHKNEFVGTSEESELLRSGKPVVMRNQQLQKADQAPPRNARIAAFQEKHKEMTVKQQTQVINVTIGGSTITVQSNSNNQAALAQLEKKMNEETSKTLSRLRGLMVDYQVA